jgi:heme o synthase
MKQRLKILVAMIKLRITLASALTTGLGYIAARGQFDAGFAWVLCGIFLLACGAAALNQVQEVDIDRLVSRTSGRPLPTGQITVSQALLLSIFLLVSGSLLLWIIFSPLVALLGLSAAVVYNGIYTPLKRVTPFAVLPGSFIGAIPPLAGWIAAGGLYLDHDIHQICFFFFVWQVPHFWLLLLLHAGNYRNNTLPSLFDRFGSQQIRRLTFSWITATAAAGMLIPFMLTEFVLLSVVTAIVSVALVIRALPLLGQPADLQVYKIRFMEINTYSLLVILVIAADRLLN